MLDCWNVSHFLHAPALHDVFPVAPVTSCARCSPRPLLRAPARALSERFSRRPSRKDGSGVRTKCQTHVFAPMRSLLIRCFA